MEIQGSSILVTGASGFVGGYLALRLAQAGARVRALVRRAGELPLIGAPGATPGIEQMAGDFVDQDTARRAMVGADAVVHAAATIGGDLADAERVNVQGTAGLAAAAREVGVRRFVHVSTISVYDWTRARESAPDAVEFDEDAPRKEVGASYAYSPAASPWYGATKAGAERALEDEMARGLPAAMLRLGAVLGVHPTSSWAILVPERIRAGQVTITPGGLLPWTHVENVALAARLALGQSAAVGRAYNVVDGHVTVERYVEDVRTFFPDAAEAPRAAPPPQGTFAARCASERLRRELGYAPIRSYEDGMAEAAAWWRERA